MAKSNIIQLPSDTLHKTDEKNASSSPKKNIKKQRTMMMCVCHMRSITRVTKMVVIIITPSSAMPVKGKRKKYIYIYIKTTHATPKKRENSENGWVGEKEKEKKKDSSR